MPNFDAIQIAGVSKRLGTSSVLSDLTLRVPTGSTTALLGRNGAGKTTLMRILSGLLPRDRGRVSVLGLDPGRWPRAVKARIGYVAESSHFHPRWRVADALDLVRSLRKNTWDAAEARRLLRLFDLPKHQRIGRLSKGHKAELALVLALANRPDLILLDEPASGLDPVVRREVLAALVDAIHAEGRTVFLASHRLEDVERLADRIAFLGHGRILLEGNAEEIRSQARRVVVRPVVADEAFEDVPGTPLVRRFDQEAVLTYMHGGVEASHRLRESRRFLGVEERAMNLEEIYLDLLSEEPQEVASCGV